MPFYLVSSLATSLQAHQRPLVNAHSKVKKVPGNAVEIILPIRISDTLVSPERKNDCICNGLAMVRGTTRRCLGYPMMFEIPELHKLLPCIRGEQAEIGSSHMVHVMPRTPTCSDRCVKGAANLESSQRVGWVDPIIVTENRCLWLLTRSQNDLWMFVSRAPPHLLGGCWVGFDQH